MTTDLSPNTQAVLLLTAPLIAGHDSSPANLLTPSEYKRLARHLREIRRQPADLVSEESKDVLRACRPVLDESRLQRLLERGFLLSQAIDRWHTRAIWVISRADSTYPKYLKTRLREDAPAVLYGCGDIKLLERGGLAVVGSRHVTDDLVDYSLAVGRNVARAGRTVVSGGAKGIDQAAMRGALEAGGSACGVLADRLERAAMNREHRMMLLEGRLTLISPYDPGAGFNVGNAMQRNKLIFALADAALVVNADLNKGGTWAGAIEQLEKYRFVPVYIRSTGEPSPGLEALRARGALPWPNPDSAESLTAVLQQPLCAHPPETQEGFAWSAGAEAVSPDRPASELLTADNAESKSTASTASGWVRENTAPAPTEDAARKMSASGSRLRDPNEGSASELTSTPAEALFAVVSNAITQLLVTPMRDEEVAAALDVSRAQAKIWLQRLVDEGKLEKRGRPPGYAVRQKDLLG